MMQSDLMIGINTHSERAIAEVRTALSMMCLIPNVPCSDLHGMVEILSKLDRVRSQSEQAIAAMNANMNIGENNVNLPPA
jgi:CRISPR/Cas system CMR subunit Cmr6 (Cas7 group RAMP superfamily)